ncbi:hypothetical protein F3Y22_tig00004111pilonHSYRG00046 [Hibiscus syriacus]|uniref:Uncharacterized protein n=1 Tax=Hibiscus syriacus TaxID=106335 RepID=A0A6A3CM17_HIBSY|nr:hypothetical protein F3Y22_tig00004111pilonHSYRG00046 [Hibiscus syriacus]
MVLHGHGDSSVRVCDPCKKLEEAARFELRHGNKSRTGRGSLKPAVKDEDDVFKRIVGVDGKESSSSGVTSNNERTSGVQMELGNDMASISPETLRRQGGKHWKKEGIIRFLKKGNLRKLLEPL